VSIPEELAMKGAPITSLSFLVTFVALVLALLVTLLSGCAVVPYDQGHHYGSYGYRHDYDRGGSRADHGYANHDHDHERD
jgi:hypothetical protein